MRFFRRSQVKQSYISYVSERSVRGLHDTILRTEEPKYCLEIGLNGKSEDCITLDLGSKADIVGDIRGAFAQHGGYKPVEEIEKLPLDYFHLIKAVHVIEHIEWLYQQVMFDWFFDLIAPGHYLYVDTPNLDYIIEIYNNGIQSMNKGNKLEYPMSDHPDFTKDRYIENFTPWVNYKIFSGCSPGDYHHTCLNSIWLGNLLHAAGFENIKIHSGRSLIAIAMRPKESL